MSANVPNNGGWDWTAGANTAPDGTYTITQLPPVSVAIQFHDCNGGSPYIDQWYDNQPSFQQATMISLAAGDDRQAVDAQLASGISVSGTVTDAGGNPIPGINVNVNPTGSGPNAGAQTDSNGNYTTNALPPGDYRVQFSANNPNPAWATQYWNDKPSWNSADTLTLTAGDAPTRAGIDATLAAAATISGTVTGPNGAPVQGECVNAIVNGPNGYDGIGNTNTAADGTYSIQGLPADSYLVYFQDCNNVGPFQDQWWNDQPDPSSANAVTVGAGTTTAGIDAHLGAAAQIEGHVTDGGGHPIEGICAQATSASAVGGMARTNSSGDYAINIAQPGAYKVQFIDCNQTPTYAGQWWDNQPTAATATVVNVAAAQVVDHVDASLAPGAAATVSGRIVNIHGTPMTDACVVVYAANQLALFGQVQPDGSYSIPNVPSGTYALAALGCGTGGGDPSPVVPDPDSPTTNFAALWWKNVPLSLGQNSQGGPDPIAQGADLVADRAGTERHRLRLVLRLRGDRDLRHRAGNQFGVAHLRHAGPRAGGRRGAEHGDGRVGERVGERVGRRDRSGKGGTALHRELRIDLGRHARLGNRDEFVAHGDGPDVGRDVHLPDQRFRRHDDRGRVRRVGRGHAARRRATRGRRRARRHEARGRTGVHRRGLGDRTRLVRDAVPHAGPGLPDRGPAEITHGVVSRER